ncbi:hypothetical protein QBC44DRAFT_373530 [Cladorrhinum sp. PSN332]|nr:hypothetical protein QBC44DRAFT_373530 [Cladorrhinum sp. PSN332]
MPANTGMDKSREEDASTGVGETCPNARRTDSSGSGNDLSAHEASPNPTISVIRADQAANSSPQKKDEARGNALKRVLSSFESPPRFVKKLSTSQHRSRFGTASPTSPDPFRRPLMRRSLGSSSTATVTSAGVRARRAMRELERRTPKYKIDEVGLLGPAPVRHQTANKCHWTTAEMSNNPTDNFGAAPTLILTTDDGKVLSLHDPKEEDGTYERAEQSLRLEQLGDEDLEMEHGALSIR